MKLRVVLVLLVALTLQAQMKMSVQQLVQFLQSSIKLKHDDRKVAAYLKNIKLTEKLDASTVEDLQGEGAGPKTVEALKAMMEATGAMPKPAPPAPKPPPAVIPPPSPEDQKKIIEAAREYALNYTKRLPDFICTQVTRRYVDPSGLEFWQKSDVITTKLSYFEQKEDYKVVLLNSQPTDISYERLPGSISSGEFGSMMREIFEPSTRTEFKWDRWATLRGRRNHVYRYRVLQSNSHLTIGVEHTLVITAGYTGFVYVDDDLHTVTRIKQEAEGIPASFPVQQASRELDYDFIPINDSPFILPLKNTVRMRTGRVLVKNEVEFRMYRKFGTDSKITFDTPEPLGDDKTKEQPAQPATPKN